jgi:hypothetical protein
MARGWESKSVEEQIQTAREEKPLASETAIRNHDSNEEKPSRHKESLLLARTRILKDLQTTENPRYRAFLESSLSGIEKQLQEMK